MPHPRTRPTRGMFTPPAGCRSANAPRPSPLLAARALGLGSTLTTRHIGYAKECDEAMGIPPNYHSYAILPIGYPMGRFGPVGRGPLSEVVYLDGWGKPYPGVDSW
jgi:nitroreductase